MKTLKNRTKWSDAVKPRVISIDKVDLKKAVCSDHQECVIAKAIKRQCNAALPQQMNKVKAIILPNGRWCIENNGERGPTAPYEGPAFWPNMYFPHLVGVTDYYGSSSVWEIYKAVPQAELEWVDESLPKHAKR